MTRTALQTTKALIGLSILALVVFLIPFVTFHRGLPTGDSQKSIIWAQRLLSTGELPNYQAAIALLNRDPVDFYTPALHVAAAGLLAIGGLPAIGVFSIIIAIATAALGAALAFRVLPSSSRSLGSILTFILILTHERFLRYIREPGYHFQNIIGEFFLFALLLVGLMLLERWRWKLLAAAAALAGLLALSHQFSTFIAAFTLLPIVAALIIQRRRLALALIPVIVAFIIGGTLVGLHEKIPHIFTSTPHLAVQLPTVSKTLELMQPAWILTGLAGLMLLMRSSKNSRVQLTFAVSAIIFLVLSQGPRVGIDIPPVRALLYTVVPLSITGAFLLTRLWQQGRASAVAVAFFVAMLIVPSVSRAFMLSHTIRTNSTLTPGQLELAHFLRNEDGNGVLIDDYNRRSASWLVLSGHPMYTRIGNDLETQMNESRQSQLRRQLYVNQLDYEKIFSLGSRPEIVQLMQRQNITWLTGIDGSSDHFQHNPALQAVKKVDDITLYMPGTASDEEASAGPQILTPRGPSWVAEFRGPESERTKTPGDLTLWLLKPTTLANDIGDREDTHDYLPASLRATRLSDPLVRGTQTYRTTTAPLIPLLFNVGDYVRVLWEQDKAGHPDISVEFVMELAAPATNLAIITPTGQRYGWPGNGQALRIPAEAVPFDERGFITLTIDNPSQQPVNIDLIALGLAHIP